MRHVYPSRIDALRKLALGMGDPVWALSAPLLDYPEFPDWSGSCKPEHHHYGTGGLQQHTWEVVTLCMQNADFHRNSLGQSVDGEVLFLAALYHDIGKLWDYTPADSLIEDWEGTEHKRMIHHITRSAIEWERQVAKGETNLACVMDLREKRPDRIDNVTHCILAHHGRREWGSPVAPKTREAWILHLCDNLSARVNDCNRFDPYSTAK